MDCRYKDGWERRGTVSCFCPSTPYLPSSAHPSDPIHVRLFSHLGRKSSLRRRRPYRSQTNPNPTNLQPTDPLQPQPCANSTPTRTPAATPRRSSRPSARPQPSCSAPAPAAKSGQRSRWRWIARLADPRTTAAMATSIAAWRWRVGGGSLALLLLGGRGVLG
jgi:hypothetical protein